MTISFNLAPGVSLGAATTAIEDAERSIGFPATMHAGFQGTAAAFQDALSSEPLLILCALLTVYIVLGILYESYAHPITILSTLPSAGVGALLALLISKNELNVIGLIGIILLIGIVKKNAIMMIDFALYTEREHGKPPTEAIREACLLRFRPIMMTTMAALLGGLPLALGTGTGSELRRPLGITIVGGLIVSQMLTLFTTPVVYIYIDRLRLWLRAHSHSGSTAGRIASGAEPLGSSQLSAEFRCGPRRDLRRVLFLTAEARADLALRNQPILVLIAVPIARGGCPLQVEFVGAAANLFFKIDRAFDMNLVGRSPAFANLGRNLHRGWRRGDSGFLAAFADTVSGRLASHCVLLTDTQL